MFEAQIKAQLKLLGLDEGLWNKITVATEAEIPAAVVEFAVDRGVQSEVNRRVQQAVQTREQALKAEHETAIAALKDKATGGNQNNGNQGSGGVTSQGAGNQGWDAGKQPDIAAIVTQAVKPLVDRIAELETTRAQETRAVQIRTALKAAGLPETAEKYIRVEKDDQIAQAVEDFKKDFGAIKQAEVDAQVAAATAIPRAEGGSSASESKAIDAANARNKTTPEGKAAVTFPAKDILGESKITGE